MVMKLRLWIWSHRLAILCLIATASLLYLSRNHSSKEQVQRFQRPREKGVTKTKIGREPPIYVIGAYLIRENFLRIILVTDCRTTVKIHASFVDEEHTVEIAAKNLSIINDECRSAPCVTGGVYAEFEFPAKFVGEEVLLSAEAENRTSSVSITVQRSVPSSQRPHYLAICLPALFYYSDTVQLIEFIENWLLAGATKFFVYWQAITPSVKEVLSFYMESGINIELVAWPQLFKKDADLTMYYSGQLVTINDCLHKARSQAKFAATVDLDELIVVNSSNFFALLNVTMPTSAGWRITRSHAHFEKEPTYADDPRLLSFAPLGEVHSDQLGSAVNKLILRPQNVRRSFIHWTDELEPYALPTSSIPSGDATLIHLRSMSEVVDQKNYAFSKVLDKVARQMTENWRQRLNAASSRWQNLHITRGIAEVAQLMEECLLDLKSRMGTTCFTASLCVSTLTRNTSTVVDWQSPEKQWIEI